MSKLHPTAEVASNTHIGQGTTVWHYSHIRENCIIGENVNIGRGVYVGNGVIIGSNCKIQNYALIYEPARIGPGVFIGPGVILTNDQYPRAVNPDGTQKKTSDWNSVGVNISEGASIGAGSICIAPVEIGSWSLIAAGSTVTRNVPAYALMAGTPARRILWVGKAGLPLIDEGSGQFLCPKTGYRYAEVDSDTLVQLDD
jgi:UDP-2-acetamido-3-amino-2,3-dideoxy-glucuronate N-acetyltransferase